MLTYIYAGKVFCENFGRAIREKLKKESKAPIFPDERWSYNSKDYPKGPYHSNKHTRGSPFNCAACNCPLGLLVVRQLEGKIIDYWTDPSLPPDISRAGYKEYVIRVAKIDVDGLTDRRRRRKKPSGGN